MPSASGSVFEPGCVVTPGDRRRLSRDRERRHLDGLQVSPSGFTVIVVLHSSVTRRARRDLVRPAVDGQRMVPRGRVHRVIAAPHFEPSGIAWSPDTVIVSFDTRGSSAAAFVAARLAELLVGLVAAS